MNKDKWIFTTDKLIPIEEIISDIKEYGYIDAHLGYEDEFLVDSILYYLKEHQQLKIQVSSREEVANKYKEVIEEVREYINSNPNVFYDEYLIDIETLKNNECIDDTVGEIKFISNLLQILDKGESNE